MHLSHLIEVINKLPFEDQEILEEHLVRVNKKERKARKSKIAMAFRSVPDAPVPAEEFCNVHGIALTTLKQQRRYDQQHATNPVNVRSACPGGVKYVWRGPKDLLARQVDRAMLCHY